MARQAERVGAVRPRCRGAAGIQTLIVHSIDRAFKPRSTRAAKGREAPLLIRQGKSERGWAVVARHSLAWPSEHLGKGSSPTCDPVNAACDIPARATPRSPVETATVSRPSFGIRVDANRRLMSTQAAWSARDWVPGGPWGDGDDIEHAHPYLQELDEAVWARIVTELLHSTTRAAVPRDAEQLMLGAGSGTLLFRVTGTASTGPGTDVPWSVIVKFLTHEPGLGDPSDADLGAWNYWKREWHVCRSDWLAALPGPFVAARCLATGELAPSDSMEVAWLALEDLAEWDVRPWALEQFAETSRHLGLFHGGYLGGRPLPSDRWLSRHWLTGWVDQAADAIVRLPTVMDHPTLRTIYPTDVVDSVTEVWRSRDKSVSGAGRPPSGLVPQRRLPAERVRPRCRDGAAEHRHRLGVLRPRCARAGDSHPRHRLRRSFSNARRRVGRNSNVAAWTATWTVCEKVAGPPTPLTSNWDTWRRTCCWFSAVSGRYWRWCSNRTCMTWSRQCSGARSTRSRRSGRRCRRSTGNGPNAPGPSWSRRH